MPFSTAGTNWRGIAPPKMSSSNWKSVPRGSGSTRILQSPNWPWPPVCFLWRPVRFGRCRDGFAIRDARRLQVDLDAEPSLQLGDSDFDVQLALAGQQELVRLRIAPVFDRWVLFLEPMHRRADLVLVAAALRLDRIGQHGLRELDRGDAELGSLLGYQVAGVRVLQLGDGAKISSLELRYVRLRFSLQRQQVSQPLGRVTRGVVHGRVRLERARDDAQHRDAAGEGIGNGFPDERRVRSRFRRLHAERLIAIERGKIAMRGRRHVIDDGVEQRLEADGVQARRADQREDLAGHRGRAQSCDELFLRERSFGEERLHELLVGLRHHLDQLFARALRGLDHRRRNVSFGHLPAAVGGKRKRFHRDQVDDAGERFFLAQRQLDWNDFASAIPMQ